METDKSDLYEETLEFIKVAHEGQVDKGGGPYWPHPVINNGVLYIRHEDAFMAYNIAK